MNSPSSPRPRSLTPARTRHLCLLTILAVLAAACGALPNSDGPGSTDEDHTDYYASDVVAFEPGDGAGHGRNSLPDVVVGPPDGAGSDSPTRRVLSLGAGGEVVLDFGDRRIVDGPGADLIVFENPFYTDYEDDGVWEELGAVAVSRDGESWREFDCSTTPNSDGDRARWPGCAGWTPTRRYNPADLVPPIPDQTGGNAFDLADLGMDSARYVRIRDLSESVNGGQGAAGFDLDAVAAIHLRK